MRKASYNPFLSKTPSADTISLSFVKPFSKVLELGCSTGYLGNYMRSKKKCFVVGVEIDKKASSKAKKVLNTVIVGDIEDNKVLKQIKKHAPFNLIFTSAILEHLKNPQYVLSELKPYLSKNGFFVITLPNIAHWTARLSIISGNFTYQDAGIFDKTHLHFYTLKSAREFLLKSGLQIIDEKYEFFVPRPLHFIAPIFPNLFAYQIIFLAKPK